MYWVCRLDKRGVWFKLSLGNEENRDDPPPPESTVDRVFGLVIWDPSLDNEDLGLSGRFVTKEEAPLHSFMSF